MSAMNVIAMVYQCVQGVGRWGQNNKIKCYIATSSFFKLDGSRHTLHFFNDFNLISSTWPTSKITSWSEPPRSRYITRKIHKIYSHLQIRYQVHPKQRSPPQEI